jgi:hypothetical protein
MKYCEAPDNRLLEEKLDPQDTGPWIFLAGGISNCPNWQVVLRRRLQDLPDSVTLLNPRRAVCPMDDAGETTRQITWEFRTIRNADLIVFWFPCQAVCPITLYELGYWNSRRRVSKIVGIHPLYSRRQDVEIQTKLVNMYENPIPITPIVYSLAAVEQEIRSWCRRRMP